MTGLITVLLGAAFGLGLWMFYAGLRGTQLLPTISALFPSDTKAEAAIR